jgi:TusA-related sulfurtransferase
VVVQLIAGLSEHEAKLEVLAEEHGRRLVGAVAGRADGRDFAAAAVVAVEALRAAFPEARLARTDNLEVEVEGLEVGLRLIGEVDGAVGDALARGFLRGALAAAGAPTVVSSRNGRVTARLDEAGLGAAPSPSHSIDARGHTYQQGVVATMRAMTGLKPGEHLEVLTDLEGAPRRLPGGPTAPGTRSSTSAASATSRAARRSACCFARPPACCRPTAPPCLTVATTRHLHHHEEVPWQPNVPDWHTTMTAACWSTCAGRASARR